MRSLKKPLFLLIAVAVLVSVSVYATVAYFTDTAELTNTFTVGKVSIILDEEDVNPDGTETDGDSESDNRVQDGNEYHLVPGKTYMKDPMMTVKANSEACYVRMFVTINNYSEISAMLPGFLPQDYVNKTWHEDIWPCVGVTEDTAADTITYEFRYKDVVASSGVDQVLTPLFTEFTVPGELTGEQLSQLMADAGTSPEPFAIVIQGQAIQQTGFASEDAAWAAFNNQYRSNGPVKP